MLFLKQPGRPPGCPHLGKTVQLRQAVNPSQDSQQHAQFGWASCNPLRRALMQRSRSKWKIKLLFLFSFFFSPLLLSLQPQKLRIAAKPFPLHGRGIKTPEVLPMCPGSKHGPAATREANADPEDCGSGSFA